MRLVSLRATGISGSCGCPYWTITLPGPGDSHKSWAAAGAVKATAAAAKRAMRVIVRFPGVSCWQPNPVMASARPPNPITSASLVGITRPFEAEAPAQHGFSPMSASSLARGPINSKPDVSEDI